MSAFFEPNQLFAKREKYFDDAKRKAAEVAQGAGDALGAVGGALDATPVLGGLKQAGLGGLEHLSRPGAGVRSVLGGGSFGAGAADPNAAPTGFDLNKGFGLSTQNIGPLPFSPADVAGRATELATDPLSYLPGVGWAGKGAGLLGSGVKLTAPLAVDVARAPVGAYGLLTKKAPQSVAEAMTGEIPRLRSMEERLAANTQDTLGRHVPGGTNLAKLFSDRAGDSPDVLDAVLRTTAGEGDDIRGWSQSVLAPLRTLKFRSTDEIDKVIEGTLDASKLSPEGQRALPEVQRIIKGLEQQVDEAHAALAAKAPGLAEEPGFTFERLENYHPRIRVELDEQGKRAKTPVGGRTTSQFERGVETRAAGEQAGFTYESWPVALEAFVQHNGQKIAEMQLMTALADSPWGRIVEGAGDALIPGTTYKNIWFDPDTAKHIGAFLNREKNWDESKGFGRDLSRVAEKVGMARALVASGDISNTFLQNLPTLMARPAIGLATIGQGLRALANPRAHAEFLAQHQQTTNQIPGLIRGSEFFEHTGEARGMLDSTIGKLGAPGRLAARGFGGVIDASQRAWDMAGDASRIMLAEAMLPAIQREARVTSTRALGQAPVQPGFVRLYRGTAEDYPPISATVRNSYGDLVKNADFNSDKGRWFSTDQSVASSFNGKNPHPLFVDVPQSVADAAIEADTMYGTSGRLLPREWADKATRLRPSTGSISTTTGGMGITQAAAQLSDTLLHMTGAGQTRAQGLSPQRRALETGLVFAPGFFRASIAIAGDLMGGPIARTEAFNTVSKMMIGGAWMYQHIMDALPDQEPVWDPSDARFMTFEVAGNRVGFGGVYRGLANLAGKIVKAPETIGPDYWNFRDPTNENPIIKFARGRGSIPVQRGMDWATGETFNGTPIDNNFGDLAKWVASGFLPFAVSGLMQEHGTLEQKGLGLGTSLVGLRSFPRGRLDVRDEVAAKMFEGAKYDTLGPVEQARVNQSPEVKALPEQSGERGARSREVSSYFDEYTKEVDLRASQVADGSLSKSDFRKRLAEAAEVRNHKLDTVPAGSGKALTPNQIVFNKWIELIKTEDAFGRPVHEVADSYRDSLPADQQAYIDARLAAGIEKLSPAAKELVREMRAAQTLLKPYRAILATNLDRVGIGDRYEAANPVERKQIEASPLFKTAERIAKRQKEVLRRRDRSVDAALVAWYENKPIRGRR